MNDEDVTTDIPVIAARRRPRWGIPEWAYGLGALILVVLVGVGWTTLRNPSSADPAVTRYYEWPGGQMPIGITLSSMQAYVMTPRVPKMVERQMWSARYYWHANTIRIQLLQDRLVGKSGTYLNRAYLNQIREVTDYGLKQGLTIVLNAQTELAVGYPLDEPLPDKATNVFWRTLLHYYGQNPHVVVDLFNEPRRCTWSQWQPAMQNLLNYVRRLGSINQIWAEGIHWGSTLQGMPLLHDPYKSRAYASLVYSFHHPGAPWPWQAPVDENTWNAAFGYLAQQGVPIVDGEFAQFAGSYDWAYPELPGGNPRKLVPEYLNYLSKNHIGLLAWSLVPGALNSNLSFTSVSHEPQGAGQLIKSYFFHHNHYYTHSKYWPKWLRQMQNAHGKLRQHCTPYPGIPKRLQHFIHRCHRRG